MQVEDEFIQVDVEREHPEVFAKCRQALQLLETLFEPLPSSIALSKLQEVVFAHCARAQQMFRGILLLARFGFGLDCIVLLRSLVELTINAYYLTYEKRRKALYLYLKYGRVEQYETFRQLLEFQKSQQRTPTIEERLGKERLRTLRRLYQRSKKSFVRKNRRLAPSWCGIDLRQRAKFVDARFGSKGNLEEFYVIVTKQMGNPITHASALGLSQISPGAGGARFDASPSSRWIRECLFICLGCIFLIAQLANLVGEMKRDDIVRRIEEICKPD